MTPVISPSQQPNRLYLGATRISRAYMGATKAWEDFTPAKISGLVVWLDASQLALADGAAVSPWPDLSGLGHHGNIQGSPPPKVSTNKLNGKSIVRFTVSEGRVRGIHNLRSANPPFGGGNFTVTYVARMLGNPGRIFTVTYPPENFLIGFHTTGLDWFYDNGSVGPGVTGFTGFPTPWKLYTGAGSHDGTYLSESFYSNGTLLGERASGGTGMADNYNLSGYAATEETCDFEAAELVIYNRRLTDTERGQVENYIKAKWGL